MGNAGFISGLVLAVSVLFCAGTCDRDDVYLFSKNKPAASIQHADTVHTGNPLVRIQITSSESETPDVHRYLNTIDWELRQPHDFSRAQVTTTANSAASSVRFTYRCGDLEATSLITPDNGHVKDTIDWECSSLMTAKLEAVKGDTLVEYEYSIDIGFLNNLGLN
jgi:hypothetical protein